MGKGSEGSIVLLALMLPSLASAQGTPADYPEGLPLEFSFEVAVTDPGFETPRLGFLGSSADPADHPRYVGFRTDDDTVAFVYIIDWTEEFNDLQLGLETLHYANGTWTLGEETPGPDGLVMVLNDVEYRTSDAEFDGSWFWESANIDWQVGQTVNVRLIAPTSTPVLPVVGSALLGLLLAFGGAVRLS